MSVLSHLNTVLPSVRGHTVWLYPWLSAEEKEAPQEAWQWVILTREGSQEILPQEEAQQETQQEAQETWEEEKERRGGLIQVGMLCLHFIDNAV